MTTLTKWVLFMNLNKYSVPEEPKPVVADWKDSVPVVLLSDALKILGKKHGIKLYVDEDARPTLSFRPGMGAAAAGSVRWSIAEQITELFLSAADDLQALINAGKLNLPQSTHRRTS